VLYRHPASKVIVAGGAVGAPMARDRLDPISLIGQFKVDYAIIALPASRKRAAIGFDYREVQAAQRSSPTPAGDAGRR